MFEPPHADVDERGGARLHSNTISPVNRCKGPCKLQPQNYQNYRYCVVHFYSPSCQAPSIRASKSTDLSFIFHSPGERDRLCAADATAAISPCLIRLKNLLGAHAAICSLAYLATDNMRRRQSKTHRGKVPVRSETLVGCGLCRSDPFMAQQPHLDALRQQYVAQQRRRKERPVLRRQSGKTQVGPQGRERNADSNRHDSQAGDQHRP